MRKDTLSPGWSANARRNRLGMTNCPFVEMVAVSILSVLPVLQRHLTLVPGGSLVNFENAPFQELAQRRAS